MHIPVGVYPIKQAKRVTGDVPPGVRVVVASPVVMESCLRVEILPWEPQVEGRSLAGDAGLAERAVIRLPNYLAAGIGVYMFIVVWLSAKRSQIHLLWLPLFEIEGRMIFQLP